MVNPDGGNMDVLTGRITREVYFDPSKLIGKDGKVLASTVDETKQAEMLYKPVKVVQELVSEKIVLVRDEFDQVHRLTSEGLLTVKAEAKEGVPDILDLNDFSEMSLLESLRSRYARDEVYTFVGPILISINPYKWNHALYSESAMIHHHTQAKERLAPHLFKVADASYVAFINDGSKLPANQSIIISGESGAGKTEAMKIIMQYLARITHYRVAATPDSTSDSLTGASAAILGAAASGTTTAAAPHLEVGELEKKVLSTNPFLESFGNAKTLMNDNSSRFGKYVKIQFGATGRIVGAEITNYLLEKTRIVRQAEGERNFHIFYQIIRGGDKDLLADLCLDEKDGTGAFRYLTHGHCTDIAGKSDVDDFKVTMECMTAIGLDARLQRTMLELVAAVLHLGNVSFQDAGEGGSVPEPSTQKHLELAARFLKLDAGEMQKTFCSKQITTRKDETVVKPNDAAEAADKRDTLAKTVYSCVFNWLVRRLNLTIAADKCWGFMGVLDIYGFEAFEHNSFEQLLINFANETLQNQFNRHIFEMEQEDYEREGIDWSYVSFNDNQPCLALLDSRYYREAGASEGEAAGGAVAATGGKTGASCLFNILDDVKSVGGGPGKADARFLSALHTTFAGKSEAYVRPRLHSDVCFGVKHYAGLVLYEVDGFVERNVENLHQNVRALALSSTDPLIRDDILLDVKLFEERSHRKKGGAGAGPGSAGRGGKGGGSRLREASLSSQFRSSLATLVETLDMTTPRYVRCVKPNHEKLSGHFDSKEILRQLRYAGMMEAIRIRQQGYALREPHSVMYKQFARLVPGCASLPDLVEKLSRMLNVDAREWQMGVSKVFMRKSMAEKLARLLELRVKFGAHTIQRAWTRLRRHRAAVRLQATIRKYQTRRRFLAFVRRLSAAQAMCRMRNARRAYLVGRCGVIQLQAYVRSFLCVQEYRRITNPYNKLEEDALLRLIIELEADAKTADERKAFDECVAVAEKIKMVECALTSVREAREPLPYTRKSLEGKVAEVESAIEDMSLRKNFVACSKLQIELQSLIELRRLMPTRQEVLNDIAALQTSIDEHFQSKNFKACDEVQLQVKVLELKFRDILNAKEPSAAEATGFRGRGDLEAAVKAAEEELMHLEAAKNFAACQKAQEEVNRLSGMRKLFPTSAEKEHEIEHLEAAVRQAAQDRKYIECDRLQQQVEDARQSLQAIIEQEKREAVEAGASLSVDKQESLEGEKSKKSRSALEVDISTLKKELALKLAAKEFARCESLQKELDLLEAELSALPTLSQLESRSADLKMEIQKLLAAKKFVACEPLQSEVDGIQEEIRELRAAMPQEAVEVLSSARAAPSSAVSSPARSIASTISPAKFSPSKSVSGRKLSAMSFTTPTKSTGRSQQIRPVSKLRPDKPLVLAATTSVAALAQVMVERRAAAVLLTGKDGTLSGILTDTDVTRRVVSKELSVEGTTAEDVMTANPTTVTLEDDCLDALTLMVRGSFRHLPVLDSGDAVVGCLDIAKCLNDAITRLEKMEEHREKQSGSGTNKQLEAAAMAMALAGRGGGGKHQTALVSTLMQLLSSSGGNGEDGGSKLPSVGSMLSGASSTALLLKEATVLEASREMAASRKACLVVGENGELIGLVTFKDVLGRVVAKGLSPGGASLGEVMTPKPASVTPDMSLLDALYTMRDGHFLNLPVVEESGRALGLLSAMEIVQSLSSLTGKDDGGRSFWASTMGEGDDAWESQSEAGSMRSGLSGVGSIPHIALRGKKDSSFRPVSKLRPRNPLVVDGASSVAEVAKAMVHKRTDAALVTSRTGKVLGILTDNDVTRRVIAQYRAEAETPISTIMTENPKSVSQDSDSIDALTTMVKGRFRHLPVMGPHGQVVGLLDIAKCLSDAITRLERREEKTASSLAAASAGVAQGGHGALMHLMQLLQEQSEPGRDCNPSLRALLGQQGAATNIVRATVNVRTAAEVMSKCRKAVLVVDEDESLVGIFTPKDMLGRVVSQELSPDFTAVSSVMTARPDTIEAEATVLEALYMMRENHYLHLPVTDSRDGSVVGLVDVMEIVRVVCGREDGGRQFWASAQESGRKGRGEGEGWSSASELSSHAAARPSRHPGSIIAGPRSTLRGAGPDPDEQRHIQANPVDPHEDLESASVLAGSGQPHTSNLHVLMSSSAEPALEGRASQLNGSASRGASNAPGGAQFRLKVVGEDGAVKTVTVPTENFEAAIEAVGKALDMPTGQRAWTYVDDQKDVITVDTDEGFEEMLAYAHGAHLSVLKVTIIKRRRPKTRRSSGAGSGGRSSGGKTLTVLAMSSIVGLAIVGIAIMARRKYR